MSSEQKIVWKINEVDQIVEASTCRVTRTIFDTVHEFDKGHYTALACQNICDMYRESSVDESTKLRLYRKFNKNDKGSCILYLIRNKKENNNFPKTIIPSKKIEFSTEKLLTIINHDYRISIKISSRIVSLYDVALSRVVMTWNIKAWWV